MKYVKLVYLALGLALFGLLVHSFDFATALDRLAAHGAAVLPLICLTSLVASVLDTVAWQLAMPSVPVRLKWAWHCWRVRLFGEAFNMVVPAGSLGGEPLKIGLMKSRYNVSMREGTAATVIARTQMLVAQLVLMLLALPFILVADPLGAGLKWTIAGGTLILVFMTVGLVMMPRWQLSSRFSRRLGRWSWGRRAAESLHHVEDVEGRVWGFYRVHRGRFLIGLVLEMAKWCVGAVEVYLALYFLGAPVTFGDAILIEFVIQLARSLSFFIPGNLGTQDGAYAIMVAAFTGVPGAGLGAALLRRMRELIIIAAGFAVGAGFAMRPSGVPRDRKGTPD